MCHTYTAACQLGNTASCTITEVKQHRDWLLLERETVQELSEYCSQSKGTYGARLINPYSQRVEDVKPVIVNTDGSPLAPGSSGGHQKITMLYSLEKKYTYILILKLHLARPFI